MVNRTPRLVAALAVVTLIALGIFVGALSDWPPVRIAKAQTPESTDALGRAITVVGNGKVSLKPDLASATIGVDIVKPTIEEASAENKQTIEMVLSVLKEMGIDEADMQTTGFSVYVERYGQEGPADEAQVRYHVNNAVSVKIRDLDTVGAALDAAVGAGANSIYGVTFSVADPSAVESEARAKAIADAKAKAQELAGLSGVTLGDVVSISEIIGSTGYFPGNFGQPPLGGGGGAPIEPGELELNMRLQIAYAIE